MSRAIASFSAGTQIHFKQSLLQPRTAHFGSTVYFGGAQIKKPIFLTQTRAPHGRPNAATLSWATESLYETLGISENGTLVEIKKAYKQLARTFHPDVSHDPERVDEFTRKFIQIQEAYETLSDPKTRAMYDRDMAAKGLNLAFGFGARKRASNYSGNGWNERGDWKNKWQSQLDGLLRKSKSKMNNSWGARMRSN